MQALSREHNPLEDESERSAESKFSKIEEIKENQSHDFSGAVDSQIPGGVSPSPVAAPVSV